jgi:hypothetical protein
MKPCRECRHEVSEQAAACPHCGAPYPTREKWDGWGFEYKSQATLWSLPPLHISFKYRPNRIPVPAKGIIAIGQFACGVFTLSQFGAGFISISQFTIAGFALRVVRCRLLPGRPNGALHFWRPTASLSGASRTCSAGSDWAEATKR